MKANPLTDFVKITVRKPCREATLAASGSSVARFRIEGTFVGGCDWESNQIFKTREAAEFVMAQWKETDVTKSKNYRVVEVPLNI